MYCSCSIPGQGSKGIVLRGLQPETLVIKEFGDKLNLQYSAGNAKRISFNSPLNGDILF
jgi:hypothetical protein